MALFTGYMPAPLLRKNNCWRVCYYMQSISSITVNSEDEKFLSSFSEYKITPFSFFMLFFAILFERGKTHIKRELSDAFYLLKQDERFSDIMQSIPKYT